MTLFDALSDLEDPRRSQGLRTNLQHILIMSILSCICGHTGYRGISRFSKKHSALLTEVLGLVHEVPSHVTFRDVLMRLDSAAFVSCFHNWTKEFCKMEEHKWLSGDGKALASTVSDSHGSYQSFEAVVSLFAQESGLVLAISEYSNETKQEGEQNRLRFLLNQIEGMGAIICLDALHCQKNG